MSEYVKDEIVYWCCYRNGACYICYGMVEDRYSDGVFISLLSWKDCTTIDGVWLKEWQPDGRIYKLPKKWDYTKELFEYKFTINWSDDDRKFLGKIQKELDITNPENILDAYNKGYLVQVIDNNHSYVESNIGQGTWTLTKKYSDTIGYHPLYKACNYLTITASKVYKTYAEVFAEKQAYDIETERILNLSDFEWSIEQIDKVLDQWAYQYHIDNKQKQVYRDFIMDLPKLIDIEIRSYLGNVQWKYWKDTRWNNIEVSNWFLK